VITSGHQQQFQGLPGRDFTARFGLQRAGGVVDIPCSGHHTEERNDPPTLWSFRRNARMWLGRGTSNLQDEGPSPP
jgi:hypothetical protein